MSLTVFGACAVSLMLVTYALEKESRHFIAAFALGCALSSCYGFLASTWPFGAVEAIWAVVALRRYLTTPTNPGRERRERVDTVVHDSRRTRE